MTFKTGSWGDRAKARSKKRLEYFKEYTRLHNKNKKDSLGYKGELEALEILGGSKRISRPCDLEWKGKLIDVKTAKLSKINKGWNFLLSHQRYKIDLFLLICKNEEGKTEEIYLIPDKEIKTVNLYISIINKQKYKKYIMKVR